MGLQDTEPLPLWHVFQIDHDADGRYTIHFDKTPRYSDAVVKIKAWELRDLPANIASYFRLGETYDLSNPGAGPDYLIGLPLHAVYYDGQAPEPARRHGRD